MSTMVDRVARAILDKAKEDGGGFAYVSNDGDGHATFDGQFDLGRLARAAIEAMIPFVEEIPLTSLIDTSDKDLARIWSFSAESQRGAILWNMHEAIKENA